MSNNEGSPPGFTDSFSETTTRSWGSRIGGSIKGLVFGMLMLGGSIVLLFWNEGRAVQTALSLNEGAGLVVSVSAERVDPANEGKLVHISGDAKTAAPITDPDFGVSASSLRLARSVEMYQWKEETRSETRKNFGGSDETVTTYNYIQVWSDSRIDSNRFKRPEGHVNPPMRHQRRDMLATDAVVGAYKPGERVLRLLRADAPQPVDRSLEATIRARAGSATSVTADGAVYVGMDPGAPRVGDLRITYRLAKTGPISIIGRQTGSGFEGYGTKAGDTLLMATAGLVPADKMFTSAQERNQVMTWILRVIGAVMMCVGFTLLLRPFVVVADVVPFIGSLLGAGSVVVAFLLTALLAPLIVAIAWFWYRPLVSLAIIAGGLVLAFAIKTLASRRSAARTPPVPA